MFKLQVSTGNLNNCVESIECLVNLINRILFPSANWLNWLRPNGHSYIQDNLRNQCALYITKDKNLVFVVRISIVHYPHVKLSVNGTLVQSTVGETIGNGSASTPQELKNLYDVLVIILWKNPVLFQLLSKLFF